MKSYKNQRAMIYKRPDFVVISLQNFTFLLPTICTMCLDILSTACSVTQLTYNFYFSLSNFTIARTLVYGKIV